MHERGGEGYSKERGGIRHVGVGAPHSSLGLSLGECILDAIGCAHGQGGWRIIQGWGGYFNMAGSVWCLCYGGGGGLTY